MPWLITQRVQVVNMSLGFYNTARGDGQGGPRSPDQSVRQAIDAGIQWVNSAGNEAQLHWGGPFTDANGDGRHEWVAGQPTMSFTLPPKAPVTVYLKWDEWTAPTDDFALCLATTPTGTRECYPGNAPAKGTPTVSLGLTNPFDQEATLYASVQRVSGTGAPRLDAFFLGAGQIQYPVPASSLAEPAAVPGVVSVGAVCTGSDVIRPYSSEGPTLDGRLGLTVVAPGSISSVIVGPAVDCQGGYGGTSAAAPHVAAALALIRQALPYATREGVMAELIERIQLRRATPGAPARPRLRLRRAQAGPARHADLLAGRDDDDHDAGGSSVHDATPPAPTTPTTHPGSTPTTAHHDDRIRPRRTTAHHDHRADPPTRAPRPVSRRGTTAWASPTTPTAGTPGRSPARPCRATATSSSPRSGPRSPPTSCASPSTAAWCRSSGSPASTSAAARRRSATPSTRSGWPTAPHVLEARLQFADGHAEVVAAPFQVDNRGRPAPERPFQLTVAAAPPATAP